jgi:hypothetical protein
MSSAYLIVALVFGVVGWNEARRFGKQYDRTPWGWHAVVWGVVFFLSLLIGLILIAIAERAGRRDAAARAAAPQAWAPATGFTPPPFGDVTFPPAQQPYATPPAQPYGQPPTAG